MGKKKSFVLHLDSLAILDDMSSDDISALFLAIRDYNNGDDVSLPNNLKLVFKLFQNQFDRDAEKYKETCKIRAESGSLGGKQKVANASKSKQKVAKVATLADNDSENDSENDSDNSLVFFRDSAELVYKSYPTKCPIKGSSTGKSAADKRRILTILKSKEYTAEKLIEIINWYVSDCRNTKTFIKNFSTFLNNIPDINAVDPPKIKTTYTEAYYNTIPDMNQD